MAGVMPSLSQPVNPNLGGDYLRQLAAGDLAATEQIRKYRGDQMEHYTDLTKGVLSNADDLAKVFGGVQTAPILENMLSAGIWGSDLQGNVLQPLTAGGLSGAYTGKADELRLAKAAADIAAANRSGRGGGGGGDGAGGTIFYKMPDGQILGFTSETAAKAAAYDGDMILPTPGMEYTLYDKHGAHQRVFGGDASAATSDESSVDIGSSNDEGDGGTVEDERDPYEIVEDLRAQGYEGALVINGEAYVDPAHKYYGD